MLVVTELFNITVSNLEAKKIFSLRGRVLVLNESRKSAYKE